MTSDDIADGVADVFNAIEDKLVAVQAANPPEVPELDVEAGRASCQVYPYEETETAENQTGDTSLRRVTVNVLLHAPVNSVFTRAKGLEWLAQLRQSLEGARIGRYVWTANETVTLWDFDALREKRQFMSLFRATFYDIA